MILDVEFREFLEISPDILTSLPLVCFQKRSRSRTLGYRYYLYLDIYLHLLNVCVLQRRSRSRTRGWSGARCRRTCCAATSSRRRCGHIYSVIYNYLPLSIISTGGPHQQAGAGVDQAGAAEPRPGRVPSPQHHHVRPAVPVHHQL